MKLSQDEYVRLRDSIADGGLKRTDAVAITFAIEHAMSCSKFREYYGSMMQTDLLDIVRAIINS